MSSLQKASVSFAHLVLHLRSPAHFVPGITLAPGIQRRADSCCFKVGHMALPPAGCKGSPLSKQGARQNKERWLVQGTVSRHRLQPLPQALFLAFLLFFCYCVSNYSSNQRLKTQSFIIVFLIVSLAVLGNPSCHLQPHGVPAPPLKSSENCTCDSGVAERFQSHC